MAFEVQTRDSSGELKFFDTVTEAFDYAEEVPSVWKVSFNAEDGSRCRFVRDQTAEGWVFEPIM